MNNVPSATLPAKLSALPERWIDKIFGRMEAMYGALFIDRWRNTDIAEMKAVWAEELASFSDDPECFGRALKAMIDECQFPPTLPEFVKICRKKYSPKTPVSLAAPAPIAGEEAVARIQEINKTILKKMNARANPAIGWADELRKRYMSGERILPVQAELASEALGEVWNMGRVEITRRNAEVIVRPNHETEK